MYIIDIIKCGDLKIYEQVYIKNNLEIRENGNKNKRITFKLYIFTIFLSRTLSTVLN